jgi:hypothetical protein
MASTEQADASNHAPRQPHTSTRALSHIRPPHHLLQEGRVIADAQSGKARQLRNLSMHLRKAAIHPYLMLADPGSYEHYRRDLVRASGKMAAVDGLLAKLHAGGEEGGLGVVWCGRWLLGRSASQQAVLL